MALSGPGIKAIVDGAIRRGHHSCRAGKRNDPPGKRAVSREEG
jgi:hypothetical protein